MANTCYTTYKIFDKEASIKIRDIVAKLFSEQREVLMIDVLNALNIPKEDIDCRGEIVGTYFSADEGLILYCETAWTELTGWRYAIESALDTKIYYIAEEPGMGYFVYNDPSQEDIFRVEYEISDDDADQLDIYPQDNHEFTNTKELLSFVEKLTGYSAQCNKDTASEEQLYSQAQLLAEKANDEFDEKDNGYYINVDKYEYIDN